MIYVKYVKFFFCATTLPKTNELIPKMMDLGKGFFSLLNMVICWGIYVRFLGCICSGKVCIDFSRFSGVGRLGSSKCSTQHASPWVNLLNLGRQEMCGKVKPCQKIGKVGPKTSDK